MMDDRSEADRARLLQDLSALADGECDGAALQAACDRWRSDDSLRASWHAYHLIGDVLRSEELASDGRRDADFMHSLRTRMAQEPVVLAPGIAPGAAGAGPRRRAAGRWWKAPVAIAAGFMAVAAALIAIQGSLPLHGGGPGSMAQSPNAPAAPVLAGALPSVEPLALVADRQLVRDARLQRYFAAHQHFDNSSALGASSGFLRAATNRVPER